MKSTLGLVSLRTEVSVRTEESFPFRAGEQPSAAINPPIKVATVS
jgi:hypothetical protein